ncbi:MAG TPA: hypothetical protein VFS30_17130 [Dehalococcoidia bacterium]|nr:hypothetical protein [Dehalococcoidia bacterium]
MKVEFLWFSGCPNHEKARQDLLDILGESGVDADFEDIDASDPDVARRLRFPGSPTIRVDAVDVEPDFEDPGDYTPRCRLYATSAGLRGTPERDWIRAAVRRRAAT